MLFNNLNADGGIMENNPLQSFLNEDLTKVIKRVDVRQGQTKEGQIYYYINIALINGYEKRLFLKTEENFCWTNAFDLLQAQTIETL